MVGVHPQVRGEPRGLPLPRADQRHRAEDQRRREWGGRGGGGVAVVALQRQQLHGLAQAHVVGQAGAEPERGQERQPRDAALLVGAQRGLEPRGRGQRFQRPLGRAVEQVAEPAVGAHVGDRQRARPTSPRLTASTSAGRRRVRPAPRRRNSRPRASASASTDTQWPRTRTSGAFAATSSAISSSPSSSSPTAIDQRNVASSSRPSPPRVSTRSAGALLADSLSPIGRAAVPPGRELHPEPGGDQHATRRG